MRIFNTLLLYFVLLCGCQSYWASNSAKQILGENPIWALEEWNRCWNKYYICYSIENMDEIKVKICKIIENDNMMCVYYWPYQLENVGGIKYLGSLFLI